MLLPRRLTRYSLIQYIPVLLFSKQNKIFVGYFEPEDIFLDNENK